MLIHNVSKKKKGKKMKQKRLIIAGLILLHSGQVIGAGKVVKISKEIGRDLLQVERAQLKQIKHIKDLPEKIKQLEALKPSHPKVQETVKFNLKKLYTRAIKGLEKVKDTNATRAEQEIQLYQNKLDALSELHLSSKFKKIGPGRPLTRAATSLSSIQGSTLKPARPTAPPKPSSKPTPTEETSPSHNIVYQSEKSPSARKTLPRGPKPSIPERPQAPESKATNADALESNA